MVSGWCRDTPDRRATCGLDQPLERCACAYALAGHGTKFVCLGLQNGAASLLNLACPLTQALKALPHLLGDLGTGPQAGVGHRFLPSPAPDRLVGDEIGT